ncbi:MAG: hypothetical protein KIT24_06250 [Phycisphaeraceae bacterium]|nr:hypothetical protein [Phycisphaeraceae bacterium]
MVRHSRQLRNRGAVFGALLVIGLPAAVGTILLAAYIAHADLPPAPFPPENPPTEEKRLLGKILFWDEQLSTDNTVSCGTCHLPERAGADPRIAVHPGLDGLTPSPDDKFGSPGVISCDPDQNFIPSDLFSLARQVTDRSANSMINAAYAPVLFWDGRASGTFIDPHSGQVRIAAVGALESQAVAPPTNSVEMAHAERDWGQITRKLERVRPLALAVDLPPDVAAALASGPAYPQLFAAAFGDDAITAERIAMALATYQRSLISDQSPWDRFDAGDASALTAAQVRGLNVFRQQRCDACHTPPLFTNNTFRNIGLRPIAEDPGRQAVTGLPGDAGRFKVPGLRNAALRVRFMHNGQFGSLQQVMAFYARAPGTVQFPQNIDPLIPAIILPPQAAADVVDFIANGLLDPRVANGEFPFDRPRLRSELPPNPARIGNGVSGSGGRTPVLIALSPPNLGNRDFQIGITNADAGRTAYVAISVAGPINGRLVDPEIFAGPFTLQGDAASGYATYRWPIPDNAALNGRRLFMQWLVEDQAAPGGLARTPVARLDLFCGLGDCPDACRADMTGSSDPGDARYGRPDGVVDAPDFFYYLDRFAAGDLLLADLTASSDPADPMYGVPDGRIDAADFFYYLDLFEAGCL